MGDQIVTCRYCREKLKKEEAKKVGKSSYYHPECLEEKENLEEEKKLESQHYKDLVEYICEIYNLKAPTGMILKQIKEYREDPYNYKLSGMKLALQYFYETESNDVLEDSGIGIIPYVYEKAKKHYLMKLNIERSLETYKHQAENEAEPVVIDLHRKTKRKRNFIDISAL